MNIKVFTLLFALNVIFAEQVMEDNAENYVDEDLVAYDG